MPDKPQDRRFLGLVEVDSGTLLVGDPAYVLNHAAANKTGVDYDAVIATDTSGAAGVLLDLPVLLISAFGGDGAFPVFGEFEDDELQRIVVEFVAPEDDAAEEREDV
jgi:hypothetical protein